MLPLLVFNIAICGPVGLVFSVNKLNLFIQICRQDFFLIFCLHSTAVVLISSPDFSRVAPLSNNFLQMTNVPREYIHHDTLPTSVFISFAFLFMSALVCCEPPNFNKLSRVVSQSDYKNSQNPFMFRFGLLFAIRVISKMLIKCLKVSNIKRFPCYENQCIEKE